MSLPEKACVTCGKMFGPKVYGKHVVWSAFAKQKTCSAQCGSALRYAGRPKKRAHESRNRSGKIQKPGPDTPGGPRVERVCQQCGDSFWPRVVDVNAGHGKHCSTTCSANAFRRPKQGTCGRCGAPTTGTTAHKKFCDTCRLIVTKERAAALRKTFVCEKCGKAFQRRKAGNSKRFCGRSCWPSLKKTREEKQETKRAYQKSHPDIYRGSARRWYARLESNPEKKKAVLAAAAAAQRLWQKTPDGKAAMRVYRQRRRARLRDGRSLGISAELWSAMCRGRQNEKGEVCCMYCKQPCVPTVDHVIPLARGGRDEASNVVVACRSCNSSKQNKLIHEWSRARKFFSASEIEAFAIGYRSMGF
jgi:5-methylcytosine-specific restriction endonuclease McrA